jgi:hypothetical protein
LAASAEQWLNDHPLVVQEFNVWLAERIVFGPPDPVECAVLEPDYEYRYLIEGLTIRVDFIAIGDPERWMLITKIATS